METESNGVPDSRDDKAMYPDPVRSETVEGSSQHLLRHPFCRGRHTGRVNFATYSGSMWSVIAIGCIIYVALTLRYSIMRHANLASKVVIQTIAAEVLLVMIDHVTGYTGWSVNFGIPSTLLFADLAVVFFDYRKPFELAELFYVSDCHHDLQLYSRHSVGGRAGDTSADDAS